MSTGKVIVGALAGLAAGAVAGILLAPEKGSKIRKQIAEKGGKYVDELKSTYDEMRGSVSEKFENTKKDVENFAEKGKAKYHDAQKNVQNAAADYKHDVAKDHKFPTS